MLLVESSLSAKAAEGRVGGKFRRNVLFNNGRLRGNGEYREKRVLIG